MFGGERRCERAPTRGLRVGGLGAGAELVGEADGKIVVDPHQAAVEGVVVECVEAAAIAWVEAVRGVGGGPRNDMAGDEQFRDGEAGDAAAPVEGGNDSAAEEALIHAHPDEGFAFGAGGGKAAFVDSGDGFEGEAKAGGKQVFALEGEGLRMGSEFLPDLGNALGDAGEPADSAALERGVEAGEVAELHRDRIGSSSKYSGEFYDAAIAVMELAEGEVAIEVEGEEVLLPRLIASIPGRPGCVRTHMIASVSGRRPAMFRWRRCRSGGREISRRMAVQLP